MLSTRAATPQVVYTREIVMFSEADVRWFVLVLSEQCEISNRETFFRAHARTPHCTAGIREVDFRGNSVDINILQLQPSEHFRNGDSMKPNHRRGTPCRPGTGTTAYREIPDARRPSSAPAPAPERDTTLVST